MFKAGESGKELYIGTYIDLSNHTGLYIKFTSPIGAVFERGLADGVTAPGVNSPIIAANPPSFSGGSFAANSYMLYVLTSNDFDSEGEWTVCTRYENTNATPPEIIMGDDVKITVEEAC